MSDQSPYDKLGVAESATFEEIQGTRDRLLREYSDDPKKCAEVEASYDSVLMQRLKLRQEGKIKVPDGIRFAEKTPSPSLPKLTVPSFGNGGSWLSNSFGTPELLEWGVPTVMAIVLGTSVAMNPLPGTVQFVAAMATGSALYGIYRKERSLGRAVVFGIGGLIAGYLLGVGLWGILPGNLQAMVPGGAQAIDVVVSWAVIAILWLVSVFVR
jgi:Protein CHAPERONE-LIKE PROTEIN OF POR1-like